MLSVLLPESFGCYLAPSGVLSTAKAASRSPEVRQSPVILMTSLGCYFIVILSYRKKPNSVNNFHQKYKKSNIIFRMSSKARKSQEYG